MDELVTSKADGWQTARTVVAQATKPLWSKIEMAIYKLTDDAKGLPVNYEMVDATVRNHKIKVKGANGKAELVPVPPEKMVIEQTMPDGTVVKRPRYSRLIAIPRVVVRDDVDNLTIDELLNAVRQLAALIGEYDASDRVQAPDLPDGKAGRNVKRVATIASKPGGKVAMPIPAYLWSAICGAVRLDTQQNGQAVMRAKINEELPVEMGLEKPDGRVRSTKAATATTADKFAAMTGGDQE